MDYAYIEQDLEAEEEVDDEMAELQVVAMALMDKLHAGNNDLDWA